MDALSQSLASRPPADALVALACHGVRAWIALALLPIFGPSVMPAMARWALCFAVVVPVAWGRLDAPLPFRMEWLSLSMYLLQEGAIGALIGLGFGAFLAGVQAVGEIIDHQTGLTFTQNIDPTHGNHVSITSQMLERVLFACVMAAGGLNAIVDALYTSYALWPPGAATPFAGRWMSLALFSQASQVFSMALLLAGPVLLMLFIVDVGLGLLNRAAPTLNVSGMALSAKSLVGLAVLVLALPAIVQRVLESFRMVARTLMLWMASR